MIIQYCSDLHLEFPENETFLRMTPIEPIGEILILSGDIVTFCLLDKYMWFFKELSTKFKYTYWIPGNHEYYYSDISKRSIVLNEKILHNVSHTNCDDFKIGGTHLVTNQLGYEKYDENHFYKLSSINLGNLKQ